MKKLLYEEILAQRRTVEEALNTERLPLIGVLEDIRSLYNVGSCFRTADAFLLRKLVLSGFTPHPPRKEITKTALGAEESVPWEHFRDKADALRSVKDAGYHLIALELTTDSRQLHQPVADVISPDSKIALVVGNEIQGVGNESLCLCDEAVSIPMFGVKHSLNVAVAFGIGMWEFVRALAPPAGNHHSVRNVARRIDSS